MKITKIEPKKALRKLRVGAYCRVSTDGDKQMESFDEQREYYEALIRQNNKWEFGGIYADPNKSGTGADKRPEFQRMIADAKVGRLDVILCKSISRFARNISDAHGYVHELKRYDVEVRFEREALSSFDSSADMVFNMLAAVAQEESRSISENTKWAIHKKMEKGERKLGNNRILGYDTVDGVLTPNGDAWIVKRIFEDYAAGLGTTEICRRLDEAGAKRLRVDKPFATPVILRILQNEIYVGDRLLQKEAPIDYITKKADETVDFQSFYITEDHPCIIDRTTWDAVQLRLKRETDERKAGVHQRSGTHFLYGKLFCSECGSPFIRKTELVKDTMTKIWKCAERAKGKRGSGCKAARITEEDLLRQISEQLSWKWLGADDFNSEQFLATVERVELYGDRIWVVKKEAA